jgi:hypothetical protein
MPAFDDVDDDDLFGPAVAEPEAPRPTVRDALLKELDTLYRAVWAQRVRYPSDSEAAQALSDVLHVIRTRRGEVYRQR